MNRAQEHREKEIFRLLKEPGAKDALDKLCNAGCDRDGLVGWLLALSTLIAFDRIGSATRRYAFPSGKEITKLSADIEQFSLPT